MLDCWEQLNGVKSLLVEVLRNIPCQFPDTFQDKFSHLGLLRVWRCPATGERLDNLQEQGEQRTESRINILRQYCDFSAPYRKTDILLPVANIRRMIMLMKRDRSFTRVSGLLSV